MRKFALVFFVLLAASACSHEAIINDCMRPLAFVSPETPSMAVGDTVTLRLVDTSFECTHDAAPLAAPWWSLDTTIASVDSTGLMRARAPGITHVGRGAPAVMPAYVTVHP
ncbi:MAG TPA: Ig-like domain-containing protein [Gemmatimonadales bacterium]|nr:Ig-like domain-containing protein [Gemmatimonadales bacterium]